MKKKEVREAMPSYQAGKPKDWVKFATQVRSGTLARVREVAEADRRALQEVIEEALTEYLERREPGYVRPEVMTAYQASKADHNEIYQRLAK
jgi:hypothetical protein